MKGVICVPLCTHCRMQIDYSPTCLGVRDKLFLTPFFIRDLSKPCNKNRSSRVALAGGASIVKVIGKDWDRR